MENDRQFNVSLDKYFAYPDPSRVTACVKSYKRCPFPEGNAACLGDTNGWKAASGRTFDYLETAVFYVQDGTSPATLDVTDLRQYSQCARALYEDEYTDFDLRKSFSLDVSSLWDLNNPDPIHITIVPFNITSGTCGNANSIKFQTERSLAVWLSPDEGETSDPGDGSVYCDVTVNPDDCLNLPYWDIDIDSGDLVLYGTLTEVLENNAAAKEINIFIPIDFDLNLPINNNLIRFKISDDDGNSDSCLKFVQDGVSECKVDSTSVGSYQTKGNEPKPTTAKIVVSGLGRIDGWNALNSQKENGFRQIDDWDFVAGVDVNIWKDNAEWYLNALLLSLASTSSSTAQSGFAIDISGIEVAWGSKIGRSPVQLNSLFASDVYAQTSSHPAKLHDFKFVGNWLDGSDGPDIMGDGSYSAFTYTHTSDDNVKIASLDTKREHSTLLQGGVGCAINLGSDGEGDIDNSVVNGVYIHRVLHNPNDAFNGCGGKGGVICSRSCGKNPQGLVDATVSNLYIPELGTSGTADSGANSVAVPFGIGVQELGLHCGNTPANDAYPIRNLVFQNIIIHPKPFCKSKIYDNSGNVQWGTSDKPSAIFYDEANSDLATCNFREPVEFSRDPAYFVCGFADKDEAEKSCLTTAGVGGLPNVEYDIGPGVDANIKFPVCGDLVPSSHPSGIPSISASPSGELFPSTSPTLLPSRSRSP